MSAKQRRGTTMATPARKPYEHGRILPTKEHGTPAFLRGEARLLEARGLPTQAVNLFAAAARIEVADGLLVALRQVADKIGNADGSPKFTREEHVAIQTLVGQASLVP